jgi:hypothetical protein
MTYEFPTRYKSVLLGVVCCISRFVLLFVYPLIASLFVLPLFTASGNDGQEKNVDWKEMILTEDNI